MSTELAPAPYRPAPGSVTARIVDHFVGSPDLNEMSSAQIATHFGISTSNISGLLEKSVEAGLLVKRIEGRVCYYRARRDGELPTAAATRSVHRRTRDEIARSSPTAGPAAEQPDETSGFTAALYSDGELYLHGMQHLEDGGVLLNVEQAAELVAYLRHAGSVALHMRDCGSIQA